MKKDFTHCPSGGGGGFGLCRIFFIPILRSMAIASNLVTSKGHKTLKFKFEKRAGNLWLILRPAAVACGDGRVAEGRSRMRPSTTRGGSWAASGVRGSTGPLQRRMFRSWRLPSETEQEISNSKSKDIELKISRKTKGHGLLGKTKGGIFFFKKGGGIYIFFKKRAGHFLEKKRAG